MTWKFAVRGYLEMALNWYGYMVELAHDGDEVLAFVQSSRSEISAIVLDIMMPNRDGIEPFGRSGASTPNFP